MNDEASKTKTDETTIDTSGAQQDPVDSYAQPHDISQDSNQCSSKIDLEDLVGEIKRLRLEIDWTQGKRHQEEIWRRTIHLK